MRSHLELSGTADGRPVVMYVVSAADRASGRKLHPAAVHTVERIPAGIGAYYFEAEVLELGDKANITLGFMPPAANMRRLVGWDKGTFGWHGDDGMVFEQDEHGRTYSDPWQGKRANM
jgi:hypothetical protein